jgi:predicted glycosyltransferase involved in capsule biosynthesis
LEKDFFTKNMIRNSSEFLSGNNTRNQSLWGFLMCLQKHFLFINGYNERIVGWGHDDIDINQRLVKIGLKMKTIEIDYIKHLSHTILGKNIFTKQQLSTKLSQEQNIQIMKEKPWSTSDIMSKFVD